MKLIANSANGVYFREIMPVINDETAVDSVLAAIAYGTSFTGKDDLATHCANNKLRLDLWMRYDHTVPVAVPLLIELLAFQKKNVFTKFVPDWFHPKVIWWKGYGAYIGSANLTDRAWVKNIEAGVFFTDDDLVASNMDIQLEEFFSYLKGLDKCIPLTQEYISEMEILSAKNKDAHKAAAEARSHAFWDGPDNVNKKNSFDRKKESFKTEWLSTIGILKTIEEQIIEFKPVWVSDEVPAGWQVDQFLHFYYYNTVRDGNKQPYEDFYQQNRRNPQQALLEQLDLWRITKAAPSNEDQTFYKYAPTLRRLLSKDRIVDLDEEGLVEVLSSTHATEDHIIKIPLKVLGAVNETTLGRRERTLRFAPWLLGQQNDKGWDIKQLLEFVLWGGVDSELWERIYHAGQDPEYKIPRYGLNSIAEVAGWVRPEVSPPRNGRTSKALRALGFDVRIY